MKKIIQNIEEITLQEAEEFSKFFGCFKYDEMRFIKFPENRKDLFTITLTGFNLNSCYNGEHVYVAWNPTKKISLPGAITRERGLNWPKFTFYKFYENLRGDYGGIGTFVENILEDKEDIIIKLKVNCNDLIGERFYKTACVLNKGKMGLDSFF